MTTPSLFVRPKVLCFVDFYLPGYKGGGPIRTISNVVGQLSDEFEFLIVTRDRDLSDTVPYPDILIDQWNRIGEYSVFYASPATFSILGLMRLLRDTRHDLLYLNSFFSSVTAIIPLIIRRFGLYGKMPVIIAPRGEFSIGALALKATKKKLFLVFAKLIGIYSNLNWQASSKFEYEDIFRAMKFFEIAPNIMVVPNLLPLPDCSKKNKPFSYKVARTSGPLRVIFLSRIAPMKNLDYLLRALKKVNVAVEISIYGTIEDSNYWSLCQTLIQTLPPNIMVLYKGEVMHEHVEQTFAEHDVFIFPTRGENFGHVIYESLVVGTAVIVSDQTPWKSDPHGAVAVLSLEHINIWSELINQWASFNDQAYDSHRAAAESYADNYLATSTAKELNRKMFLSVIGHSN